VLAAVSVGGAAGACARFGITTAWPATVDGFPWATFVINVSGCLLIGVLMVVIEQVWPRRRLLRPFLGTGVLGGYTTFSTYVVDAQRLLDQHAAGTALTYLAATLVSALLAVYAGTALTRIVVRYARRTKENPA
jgi:CrcB protein